MQSILSGFALVVLASRTLAAPSVNDPFDNADSAPTVVTDYGTWVGASDAGVEWFKGIPYAQPPVGSLRFAAPLPPNITYGTFSAQDWGSSCLQYSPSNPSTNPPTGFLADTLVLFSQEGGPSPPFTTSEDCLNLNVWRPANAKGLLPVMFWIYGGAFAVGRTSSFDGYTIVKKSIDIDQPVIYVSPNYRVNGYGFLPGRQVKPGGGDINAGLLDQRLAMKWVQKYIHLFGGDPTRVTIFGESAGAIAVGYHLIANDGNTEGLFHAAIMQSGSPLPVLGAEGGQSVYDQIASVTGCDKEEDSFKCLQNLPVEDLNPAIGTLPTLSDYNGLHLNYLPRVDGEFITADSTELILQGKYAKVPIITGDAYDEGTLLSMGGFNETTTEGVRSWLKAIFPKIKQDQLDKLLELYPDDVTAGSPFDTWRYNNLSGQNKRVSALGGDFFMQAPRRFLANAMSKTQNVWSYQTRALISTPIFGTFHGIDILFLYDRQPFNPPLTNEWQTRWITFANNFNPNPKIGRWIQWPTYGSNKQQLQFADFSTTVELDNYRVEEIDFLISIRDDLRY